MRFILFMHPNLEGDPNGDQWEAGPDVEAVAAMTEFNESLVQAGVLLAGDGLHPPTEGARVRFTGGKATVSDGPFAEAREVVGGYWTIDVRDKAEAVAWARPPAPRPDARGQGGAAAARDGRAVRDVGGTRARRLRLSAR